MERLDEWSKSGKNRDSFRNDRAHKVLQNDDKVCILVSTVGASFQPLWGGNWNEIADLLCFWFAYAQFVHMFNNTICVGMGATYTLCWPLFPDLPNSRYYAALSMSMLLSMRLLRPNSSFPVHHCLYSYWLRSHHRSKDNSVFVSHGKP